MQRAGNLFRIVGESLRSRHWKPHIYWVLMWILGGFVSLFSYFGTEVGEYGYLKIQKQPCQMKNKGSMCVLMPSAVTLDPSGSIYADIIYWGMWERKKGSVFQWSICSSLNEALWSCADEQLLQHSINRPDTDQPCVYDNHTHQDIMRQII